MPVELLFEVQEGRAAVERGIGKARRARSRVAASYGARNVAAV